MKISSLIITYNPEENSFIKVIESLVGQVNTILIVDNGSKNKDFIESLLRIPEVHIKFMDKNYGIAKATNEGLKELISMKDDYCILSDQDTIYPKDYVNFFKKYIKDNLSNEIAAFAPVFYDAVSLEKKPIYIKRNHLIKKQSAPEYPVFVYQAIASGLIIDMKKYSEIGAMNENLFIDYVDFEWCWKVNKLGYKILCLPQLQIQHHLGDGVVDVTLKRISEHSSIRYYYITRNTFFLALYTPYLGTAMKFQLFLKACLYPLGYSILCKPHLKNARYTLIGMFDGIFKRLGELC